MHQGEEGFIAYLDVRRLEEGLLLGRREGQGHGDAIQQRQPGQIAQLVELEGDLVLLTEGLEGLHQLLGGDGGLIHLEVVQAELIVAHLDPAITALGLELPDDPEAAHAAQEDEVPSVGHLLRALEMARATDAVEAGRVVVWGQIVGMDLDVAVSGLHDTEIGLVFEGVLDHVAIAQLEDMERQPSAGQEQGAGQGEDRQGFG